MRGRDSDERRTRRRRGDGPPCARGRRGRTGPPWLRDWPGDADAPGARPPWRSSLLLAVLVLVGTAFAARNQPGREPLDALGRVLLLAGPAMLLLRRRYPVTVLYGVTATTLVYVGAGYPYGPALLTVAVAVFTAVLAGHRHAAWWALGLLWSGHLLIAHWLYRYLPPGGDAAASWGQELPLTASVVALVTLSELARERRAHRARRRAEREAAEKRRADEERMRIARELHDVLAHSISVINVQAGVGLALLDSDPEQARTALTTIKAAGKEALGEVRQVLDTLRTPGETGTAPRTPAPGLDRLPELVEQAASAGLAVEVTTEGTRVPLPPGADLAAFRIVQEALTNVVRHSGSRTARVHLRHAPGRLDLRVDDDGPATGTDAGGTGNGLAGMRERAASLGGGIEAGPRPDGGFRVRATLPFDPRESP
ncbi:sensor histidine kinase [Streptomyces sp. NPDC016309]|uniref:sensor histidine kinase n=1 Tax=Streptomyces sp. NPDC016309 TaxID=3364965 RepID=UPI0036FE3AE2